MSLKEGIKKVLVLGKGDETKINRKADYIEMQVCRTLVDEGYEVLLLTTAPPTLIFTSVLSNSVYHLPLTIHSIKEIVEEERPDAVFPLPTGVTGPDLVRQLEDNNYWKHRGVMVLGMNYKTASLSKNREELSEFIDNAGLKQSRKFLTGSFAEADRIRKELGGFPVFLRHCSAQNQNNGTQIVRNESELYHYFLRSFDLDPFNKVWLEECLEGQKEVELGIIRDNEGGTAVIFAAESVDPVGIHNGDSIIVSPPQTLTNKQFNELKKAAVNLIQTFKNFTGYCTLKFALDYERGCNLILDVDFVLDHSSALASLAVGYPIGKILARLTIGYKVEELISQLKLPTLSEELSNHVLLKVPYFNTASREQVLDEKKKSTGENVYAGQSFKEVLNKAWKAEPPVNSPVIEQGSVNREKLRERLMKPYQDRLQNIYLAFKIGTSVEEIHDVTRIDRWFLQQIKVMAELENRARKQTIETITLEELSDLKKAGFSNNQIAKMLSSESRKVRISEVCLKAELKDFSRDISASLMPLEEENIYCFCPNGNGKKGSFKDNRKVLVLIGTMTGSLKEETDQATSYFFIREAKRMGYEVIVVNCNPYSAPCWLMLADKLYVEPTDWENIYNIYLTEEPKGVLIEANEAVESNLLNRLKKRKIKIFRLPSEVGELPF